MAETVMNEVLCIPGTDRNYAVEFTYVEEICQSLQISAIPCLPRMYSGMGNYKGTIIPIIYMEHEAAGGRKMIMILKHQRYVIGVEISPYTFIAKKSKIKQINRPNETGGAEIWKEKAIYQVDDKLYSLIDVEKTFENLVLYP